MATQVAVFLALCAVSMVRGDAGFFGSETPEVAAARRHHEAAHAAALRVLPKIPEHEQVNQHLHHAVHHPQHRFDVNPAVVRLDPTGLLLDTPEVAAARREHEAAFAAASRAVPQVPSHHHAHHVPVHVPVHHGAHFDKFAEEIPRSALGETPEVAAAREAHEAAVTAARQVLPVLPQEETHFGPVHHHHVPAVGVNPSGIFGDTPEVIAARRQHEAAHAAAGRGVPQGPLHHGHHFPAHVNPEITKFAEEVPRSALGETPEVAAAREAHIAFFNRVKSDLPPLSPNSIF